MSANATAADPGPAGGSLVIVGGAFERSYEDLWEEIIRLGGGDAEANIVVVPAASGGPATAGQEVKAIFEQYGAEQVSVAPLAVKDDPDTEADETKWYANARNQSVVEQIESADVVYFTGGAQHRVVDVLTHDNGTDTPVARAIRDVYERGGVLAGSSAGAAIMSDDMIGAGQSLGAIRRGVSYQDTYGSDTDNRVWLTRGMGFFEHGMVDQHFQERGRIGRLLRAMWHEDEAKGYERTELGFGIGEGTALVTNSESDWVRVLGKNYVTVVDLSDATEVGNTTDATLEMEGIRLSMLTKGDRYNLESGNVEPAEKKPIDVVSSPYYGTAPSVSPFAKNGVRRVLTVGLVDNENNQEVSAQVWKQVYDVFEDREYLLGVVFSFQQTAETEGYFGDDGYADERNRYLLSNVTADVEVRRVPVDQDSSTPTPRVETVVVTKTVTKTVQRTPEEATSPTDASSPGFGPVLAVLGLLAAALLFVRRRR